MISGKTERMEMVEITGIIPQQHPFVMVGKLLAAGESQTKTSFLIPAENVLVREGYFSASGITENIAQTAAAGMGYASRISGKPVPLGFIAAIKDLRIHELPKAGSEIITEIILVNKVLDISIIKGTVTQENKLLAECEMRIFIKPE